MYKLLRFVAIRILRWCNTHDIYTGPLPTPGASYRHNKGSIYKCIHIEVCSETGEHRISYLNTSYNEVLFPNYPVQPIRWSRPARMWFEEVKPGVLRFTPLDEDELKRVQFERKHYEGKNWG